MGRILGIDHGEKRVGLALSDPLETIAKPFRTLALRDEQLFLALEDLVAEQEITALVIGLPRGMRGQETHQTRRVRAFARQCTQRLRLPVTLEDERLSSISARKALVQQSIKSGHEKALVDQTAAAIILQQFLDRQKR